MSGKNVVRWYNDSNSVPDSLDRRLVAEGIGYVDYGTSRSLESGDADRSQAAGQAFNALEALSSRGGKGAVRAGGGELIAVGRWDPNCLGLHSPPDCPILKYAQMSSYGVLNPEDRVYQGVDDLFSSGGITVQHSVDSDPIEAAIEMLENSGRLRTPF